MMISEHLRHTDVTPFFEKSINPMPRRVGVYQTSQRGIMIMGGHFSFSFWDGAQWHPFGSWADYSATDDFLWRGLVAKSQHPLDWAWP